MIPDSQKTTFIVVMTICDNADLLISDTAFQSFIENKAIELCNSSKLKFNRDQFVARVATFDFAYAKRNGLRFTDINEAMPVLAQLMIDDPSLQHLILVKNGQYVIKYGAAFGSEKVRSSVQSKPVDIWYAVTDTRLR